MITRSCSDGDDEFETCCIVCFVRMRLHIRVVRVTKDKEKPARLGLYGRMVSNPEYTRVCHHLLKYKAQSQGAMKSPSTSGRERDEPRT